MCLLFEWQDGCQGFVETQCKHLQLYQPEGHFLHGLNQLYGRRVVSHLAEADSYLIWQELNNAEEEAAKSFVLRVR